MSPLPRLMLCAALLSTTGACDSKSQAPSQDDGQATKSGNPGGTKEREGTKSGGPDDPDASGTTHRMARVDAKGLHPIAPVPLTIFVSPTEAILQRGNSPKLIADRELGRADPRKAESHLIGPLFDAIEQAQAKGPPVDETWADTAMLVLDPDTNMEVLVDVLYTGGRAGLAGYQFAVDSPEGKRVLQVLPPKFCAQRVGSDDACARPQVVFTTDGLMLSARRIGRRSCTTVDADAAPYAGKTITGPDGRCPVPRGDGPEAADLGWFLEGLAGVDELCQHAMFSAESSVRWQEMAPTLAELHAAMLHGLVIEAGIPAGYCGDTLAVGKTGG